jgi:hypothetical protein
MAAGAIKNTVIFRNSLPAPMKSAKPRRSSALPRTPCSVTVMPLHRSMWKVLPLTPRFRPWQRA